MALWQWYKSFAPRTRMAIGAGVMAYAVAGLFVSDTIEEKIGFTPTEQDKEALRQSMPKISVVDKPNK